MATTEQLFHERGPEANNLRAAAFESQLESMASTLGWTVVCRNVDTYLGSRTRSRGLDMLCGLQNPQTGQKDGLLCEAKVHGQQVSLAGIQEELQTLHDKITGFNNRQGFTNNTHVRDHVDRIVWGLLGHQTIPWNQEAARASLRAVELRSLHKAPHVTTLIFAGPNTLEAIADCFQLRVESQDLLPAKFYWPACEEADYAWSSCCPPHQLAAGLLAYKTTDGRTVLWVRDTLVDKDLGLIEDLVFQWRVDPNIVVFAELTPDTWRVQRAAWDSSATRTATRRHGGVLPGSQFVQARSLDYKNMNRFTDLWPASETR